MSATETKTEGKADEMKGKAKETWGRVTDDEDTEAQGKADQAKGHGKQAWGDVKSAAEDMKPDD